MALRPAWKGYLKLSLVTCPVQMEPARTAGETLRFHTVNRETGNRVESQYVDAETGKPVAEEDQAKGYEIDEERFVMHVRRLHGLLSAYVSEVLAEVLRNDAPAVAREAIVAALEARSSSFSILLWDSSSAHSGERSRLASSSLLRKSTSEPIL